VSRLIAGMLDVIDGSSAGLRLSDSWTGSWTGSPAKNGCHVRHGSIGPCHPCMLMPPGLEVYGEPTAVTMVAVAMVVRVTNEPWRAREKLPPIEGPRR